MKLEKILNTIKRKITAPLIAGALTVGAMMPAYAAEQESVEAAQEDPKKTDESFFQGNLIGSNIDNIVTFNHDNGGRVHYEAVNSPWQEVPQSDHSLGLRTPSIAGKVRLSGTLDASISSENYLGATEMVEVLPADNVIIRAGGIQSTSGKMGGFAGAKFTPEHFTADFEAWYDGTKFDTHGFIAGIIPVGNGELYLSIGGELGERDINTTNGWYNVGGTGIFTGTHFDIDNNTQSLKAIIVPKGYSRGRGFNDFYSHINNRTEMRAVTTGFVQDSWAPFDAFAVDGEKGHAAVAVYANNSEEAIGGKAHLYVRPIPQIFLGVGAGYSYDKVAEEHNPNLVLEAYGAVPGTPVEGWITMDQNLRTGEPNVTGYVGFVNKF
ncbi:MAG: hypothetical protein ABIG93_03600 [archaeon]|nr:hypothetical protein [Nanoarchaeota archaeon]